MKKKCALIVDDSRTAREVLANKLTTYGIDIVKVDSAANAIDYLYGNTPDAVFMDLEMPGMDGFQALRIIKSNPNTATIPVMMYTSKEGGLALGEARALGAIGVLPKQLKTQDLDEVMQQLHLLPEQISLVQSFQDGERYQAGMDANYAEQTTAKVEYLGEGTGRHARVEYPGEVYDESLFVLKRQTRIFQKDLLATEQRLSDGFAKEFNKLHEQLFDAGFRTQDLAVTTSGKSRRALWVNLLLVCFLGILWWKVDGLNQATQKPALKADIKTELADIRRQLVSLETSLGAAKVVGGGYAQVDFAEATTHMDKFPGIEILSWAANRGTEFEYGENPYDDTHVVWLADLVKQLTKAGFQGVVNLQAHFADFCLSRSETGGFALAGEQLPFDECLFTSKSGNIGFAQTSYQTLGFANYVNSLSAEDGGAIEIFVDNDVVNEPVVPYPDAYSVKTAGEWNRIARQNQRVIVNLFHKTEI